VKKLIWLILFPGIVLCQPNGTKYIVVRGTAEVKVPVDYLKIFVSVHSYNPTEKIASDSNHLKVMEMLDVLSKYDIADSDFQTTDNSSRQDLYTKDPDRRSIITYSAEFNLRKVKAFDSLFQELVNLGNIDVSVRANGSVHGAGYKLLAYQKAYFVALHEAEVLTKAAGQKLGNLIKLIQDNRDVFTQYDDINQIVESLPNSLPQEATFRGEQAIVSAQAAGQTFRRDFYTQTGEVIAIFEIK
jgi:uncharacterized protein YggE